MYGPPACSSVSWVLVGLSLLYWKVVFPKPPMNSSRGSWPQPDMFYFCLELSDPLPFSSASQLWHTWSSPGFLVLFVLW